MQSGKGLVRIARPGTGEGPGQVVLLGEQVVRAIAHAARLDQCNPGGGGQHVGEQMFVLDQPRQPALHAVEQGALGQAFPLLAPPRFESDQGGGPGTNLGGGDQFACREDVSLGHIERAALVVDGELGEAIDLVAPQVDADGRVGGGGEDVDDRAPLGNLAAVFNQILAAVAEMNELCQQSIGIEDGALADVDRVDLRRVGAETLEECAHSRDDDRRATLRGTQPPQHFQAVPHRLHAGADAFERQGLPRGEQHDLALGHVLHEVVVQLAGIGAGGAGDHQRATVSQLRERGNCQRTGRLGYGHEPAGVAQRLRERRFVAEQAGK